MIRRTAPLSVILAVLCACTNQQIYTAAQEHQRQECAKLPQSQYEECMAQVEDDYERYAREREELLRDKPSGEPYK